MNTTEKYKIWDTEKKEWYTPTYPGKKFDAKKKPYESKITEEILFSQSGEMYLRTNNGEQPICDTLTLILNPVEDPRFIPCAYIGMKDSNEMKIYDGHIVKLSFENTEDEIHVVEYYNELCHWGPFIIDENEEFTYNIGAHKNNLGNRVEIIGHKFTNPELLKNGN